MMKRLLVCFLLLLTVTSESWATFGTASFPTAVFHSVKTNAPVSVTWTVAGGVGLHSSSEGIFTNPATGFSIGATDIGTTLNINCVFGIASIICTSAPETFTIPVDVIAGAQALGLTKINYSREFSDGTISNGIVEINLLNSNLSISRESLRFSDNSTHKVLKQKSRITALAELKYTGSGLLDAFWEYASPLNVAGDPVFTRLQSVRRYLAAGGRVLLQSPPLPTNLVGQYILRLQILKTASNPQAVAFTSNLPDGLPILRYSVTKSTDAGIRKALPPIKTESPFDNALLQSDTHFSWQAVEGAEAYQLELYLLGSRQLPDQQEGNLIIDESVLENKKPAAGLLIPAQKTSLALSALARDMLRQQQTYYWRIIAIGDGGQILTTSPIKKLRVP